MQEEYLLHDAVRNKQVKLVKALLTSGRDANLPRSDHAGWTPMHYGVRYYEPFVFHALITHKGDPQKPDVSGLTPVDIFLQYPPEDREHEENLRAYFKKKCPELLIEKENLENKAEKKTSFRK